MKIKIFIVTYNNPQNLQQTVDSIYKGIRFPLDDPNMKLELNIINNHSNFAMPKTIDKIRILHNVLRPDFSTGFLSRNWNQALILGFENLNEPKADIVIGCQDDTLFYINWLNNLIDLHKKFSFITYGWGDNFMSWTPEAVKKIGLWDESFQMSGHTSDYFLRALIYNKNKSSINDNHHNRLLNFQDIRIANRLDVVKERLDERRIHSFYGQKMIDHKWGNIEGCTKMLTHWKNKLINSSHLIKPKCRSRILYSYFEKDIETLKEQNYLC